MDVASEEETHTEEIIEQLAFSSKGTENTTVHSGLFQQLAWGREAFDSEMGQVELVCEELLTNVCSSTVSIHSDLQLSNLSWPESLVGEPATFNGPYSQINIKVFGF